jgi:hypothetical protein
VSTAAVIVPWRDSGDPHRSRNYRYVLAYYLEMGIGQVIPIDDGRPTGQPFNRHAAYNRGMALTDADALIWNEADTLLPPEQLALGISLALDSPGIVIPFTERNELSEDTTNHVHDDGVDPFTARPEIAYTQGSSIGQCGITSRATMAAVGQWDEHFEGWGYDDNAMFHAFGTLAGPPRWVEGIGVHLWHPPAYIAPTAEAAALTQRNADRCHVMHTLDGDALRQLIVSE